MGSLVIKKLKYEGDNYYYESPQFNNGINIIVGDNGSGKSTFTYLIEYCLGGSLKYFNADSNHTEKYNEIINDTNNYVELEIIINFEIYKLKRFINDNIIFINFYDHYFSLPVHRKQIDNVKYTETFSDWLLDKLSIVKQELNLGTTSWKLNINDLLRLIIYDQDTNSKKIYKDPTSVNYVTDSLIIRKTIFEVLLGISSDEYFKKFEEYKQISQLKDSKQTALNSFNKKFEGINLDRSVIDNEIAELTSKLDDLYDQRDIFQNSNKYFDEKSLIISQVQEDIINNEIQISELNISINNNRIEYEKVLEYYSSQILEISEIEKIIFTNEKLNLFSFEVCPFCLNDHQPNDNHCLCGAEIKDKDYEKFIYSSKEYEKILNHKKKSLSTIKIALDSYFQEINDLQILKERILTQIQDDSQKLKSLIGSLDVNSNNEAIDNLNNEILENLKLIESQKYLEKISLEKDDLESDYKSTLNDYQEIKDDFKRLERQFKINNSKVISDFNEIYEELIKASSADASSAEINEDYMPIIDLGIYKNKSANVPIRLLYYFTFLALALKYENVKHPRLLIIDTPEDAGIDDDNLKNDILLLNKVFELVDANAEDYQIILTTGLEKYPSEYEDYIIERFNKSENNFILNNKI